MERNGQYWTEAEVLLLRKAQSFPELVPAALSVLARMPKPIGQVCGPISTGGKGSIELNLAVFDGTITTLIGQGITIFDQVPFEEHIFRIIEQKLGTRDNQRLLKEFYLPIFESGFVTRLYFIPGWESSEGAQWEREQGMRLGMEIIDL